MRQRIFNFFKSTPNKQILTFTIPVILTLFIILYSIVFEGKQQFSELSDAFIHGHLNFLSPIGGLGEDPINFQGKIYWGEGPFPALILIPFVALFQLFHQLYEQGYIEWVFTLGVLFFVYALARKFKYNKEDSLLLSFGFALGSVFIGVASLSSSWVFAQVLNTFLLFWGLYEFFTKKRWWLLGLICGCIFLTRATAAPIIVFFGLELWQNRGKIPSKWKKYTALVLPLIVAILLTGLYNYLRFHNPFSGGYSYQLLYQNSSESRALGIFSPIHIPANLYAMLFGAPDVVLRTKTSWTLVFPYIRNNVFGMSIFITSPYLLSLFFNRWSSLSKQLKNLLIATLLSMLAVLCYYGLGVQQFGYRYALDFLPGLFVLFMILYKKNHPGLSTGMKFLLVASGLFNFYLLVSFL